MRACRPECDRPQPRTCAQCGRDTSNTARLTRASLPVPAAERRHTAAYTCFAFISILVSSSFIHSFTGGPGELAGRQAGRQAEKLSSHPSKFTLSSPTSMLFSLCAGMATSTNFNQPTPGNSAGIVYWGREVLLAD